MPHHQYNSTMAKITHKSNLPNNNIAKRNLSFDESEDDAFDTSQSPRPSKSIKRKLQTNHTKTYSRDESADSPSPALVMFVLLCIIFIIGSLCKLTLLDLLLYCVDRLFLLDVGV